MGEEATARFEELSSAVLEGTATEAQRAEFGRLLDGHPEFVAQYMRQARMQVLLEACAGLRDQKRETGSAKRARASGWKVAAAAAALLAGAAVWRLALPASPVPRVAGIQPLAPVATVRTSRHGQWADGLEVRVGSVLYEGLWRWQGGLVELVTTSGTVLLVEAPASLEIIDALHARLLSGKLVVRMPKGCSGFVVETPEMRVLDLGTEFGVSVSPAGESQVQVFDGKVRAEAAGGAVRKELRAGETVRATTDGELVAATYEEKRFIRRFPPVRDAPRPSGVLYSQSAVETVRVAHAPEGVKADGVLTEWDARVAFRGACQPPYAETYYLEGMMMYDAANLYLAAHVGDPDPLCNTAPEGFEFAGGSVIVRVSTDVSLGWPLKGTLVEDGQDSYRKNPLSAATTNERIINVVMWYDAQAKRTRIKLEHGIDQHNQQIDPPGWQGVFRKDPSGNGYTLEYVIPWRLLNCADRPPRAGDTLAALWMVHWSDDEGRIARGQLVEVTNHQPHKGQDLPPYVFFQNGPSWGRAVYLPKIDGVGKQATSNDKGKGNEGIN